jgi:outer membrane protein assembly factor BamE
MKSLGFFFTLACGVFLQGCANSGLPRPADLPTLGDMPFVHKIDIQQGNVVTQEMIAQLAYGMDKKKVNFIMGSPVIQDTFHSDRWDYLYTISRDGGKTRRRRVTLFFEDNLLARIEGDVKPAAGNLVVDTRQDMTVDVPDIQRAGLMTKLKNTIPFVGDEEAAKKPVAQDQGAAPRVVTEEDALPTELPRNTKPPLTPV